MSDEPFDRQPKPVKVILTGDPIDVEYWKRIFKMRVDGLGDNTQDHLNNTFTIYPRAVND